MSITVNKGFTLIETVVSMFLLAVMGMLGYQAVETVLGANERSRNELATEVQMHLAWQIIDDDLLHMRARVYHDGLGGVEVAYATGQLPILIDFSRGGAVLQSDNSTSGERIRYELSSTGELLRYSWPIHLSLREYDAKISRLLHGVSAVHFEQLTDDNIFSPIWPPLNQNDKLLSLPKMVRVTIEMEDGTSSWRLFPGLENNV